MQNELSAAINEEIALQMGRLMVEEIAKGVLIKRLQTELQSAIQGKGESKTPPKSE